MTLWELIQTAQHRYVGAYRHLLRQQRPRVPGLIAEPTMRVEMSDDIPIDFKVLRIDLLWFEPAAPAPTLPPPADPPEAVTPDAATPDAATPTADAPDAATPDAATPDAVTPTADAPVAASPRPTPRVAAVAITPTAPLPAPHHTQYPDGQVVIVHALAWDDCTLTVAPPPPPPPPPPPAPAPGNPDPAAPPLPHAALIAWLRRWRDRTDAPNQPPDADGLCAAVHSMTPPQIQDDKLSFTIDFGSAPPEAFTALLSTLFANGVRTVEVGKPMPSGVVNLA
jgi:hypothetical protein